MTNEPTISEKLYNQARILANNLRAKGVNVNASMGFNDLIDEVLNINQNGIILNTNIQIQTDHQSVAEGESITIDGLLSTTYDDDDDMVGYISNANIKIYSNNTLIDTVQTDIDGSFTSTITLSTLGAYSIKAVYEGITNAYDSCESSALNVYATIDTNITINVPLRLVYSDNFNITGILTDESDNTLSGKTINLLVGSTVVDTTLTNNDGEFSFTQTPVIRGNHTFQATFDGDSEYSYATSSTVTRDIDKETSVLNISTPINNDAIYNDGSLTVTGVLSDDDGTALTDEDIIITQSGNTVATLTTSNNGTFTGTIQSSNLSTDVITVSYEGSDNYTHSTNSIYIIVNNPNISLTSDVNILSYADSESATLTATYTGASVTGKTVSFDIVEGGIVVENIGTDVTDEYGVATCTYVSTGSGDILIRASIGSILSETYTIHDYPYYDASSSSNLSRYTVPSGASMTYDSTENAYLVTLTASNANKTILHTNNLNVSNTRSIQADIKLNNSGNIQGLLGLFNGTTGVFGRFIKSDTGYFNIMAVDVDGNGSQIEGVVYITVNTGVWYTLRLEFNGSSVTAKLINNGTVEQTLTSTQSTLSSSSNNLGFAVAFAQNSSYYIKNIRVE